LRTPAAKVEPCSANACHNTAPIRDFLTRSDAIASRLHPCCLAQPIAVQSSIDLRCKQLPKELHAALAASIVGGGSPPLPFESTTTSTTTISTTTMPGEAAVRPASHERLLSRQPSPQPSPQPAASPESLAMTGSNPAALADDD